MSMNMFIGMLMHVYVPHVVHVHIHVYKHVHLDAHACLCPAYVVHVHIHVYKHVHLEAYACLCPLCDSCQDLAAMPMACCTDSQLSCDCLAAVSRRARTRCE